MRDAKGGVLIDLWVQPGASASEVKGIRDGALAVRVNAPPLEGRANKACLELVASLFGLRRGDLELVAGGAGRRKQLFARGISLEAALRRLAVLVQTTGVATRDDAAPVGDTMASD